MAAKKKQTSTGKWDIRVTPQVDQDAREMAEARGMSLSAYLRWLVHEDRARVLIGQGARVKLKK